MRGSSRVRRFGAAVVGTAVALSALVGITASSSTAAGSNVGRVGVASHNFWLGEADARAELTTLANAGVRWVREDFRWDQLEPSKGVFDWRKSDALMGAASAAGVDVLAILDYSAKWASSDPSGAGSIFYPPKSNADYAAFARAVVLRYGPMGTFWASRPDIANPRPLQAVELWNEPWGWWNWKSGVDPVAYARMARAAADAIEAASPTVKIAIPADLLQVRTDGAIVDWLDKVLAADPGLVPLIDIYSVHPYPYPRQQGPMVDHADRRWDYSRITLIRDITVRRNAVRPIWITEIGWSTANTTDSVTEAKQAQYLTEAVDRAAAEWPYVERVFLYTSTKDRPDMSDREAHYGLRRADGSWKPAWAAIKATIGAADTTTTSAPTTTAAPTTTTSTTIDPGLTTTTTEPPKSTAKPTRGSRRTRTK